MTAWTGLNQTSVFYLGTHQPSWLWEDRAPFPLFVSHRRLARYLDLKPATDGWALDSGGFTELKLFGRWTVSPAEYVVAVFRYDTEIGQLEWAAPQDWMCEPFIINGGKAGRQTFAGTHLSVAEHQRLTVANYLELTRLWGILAPDRESPFMPVLQGWTFDDYHACKRMYEDAGVILECCPVVGLGSVCRRQGTGMVRDLVDSLSPQLALHGFGVKTKGLRESATRLLSADSLAWSFTAREEGIVLPGHEGLHKTCANCLEYASLWRERLLAGVDEVCQAPAQETLFGGLSEPEPCPGCGEFHWTA
jgi:hypothetical protein